jgi:serine/threonine protein kinase
MMPEGNGNEPFTDLLADYHEALASGLPPKADTPAPRTPEQAARLEATLECLRRLEADRQRGLADKGKSPPPAWALVGPDAARQVIDRFELRRELGHGGFGIVFLAFDTVLKREVALKVPRLEAFLTPELRQRFLREARAAASLDHCNLVRVYEVGEIESICYIVSAYCRGPNLAVWLREQSEPVPVQMAALLVAGLADGVAHIHEHNILHRDIKPTNILLDSPGEDLSGPPGELTIVPRLTDFGLAKLTMPRERARDETPLASTEESTRSGAVLGTPAYMAREQAQGRLDQIGPHTDVHALGVVLYEVLTGQPPFHGPTDLDTLRQVVFDEPRGLRRLRPDVPRDLEAVCLRCLEKEPQRRYASARALAGDLRRFAQGEPTLARPRRWPLRLWRAARRHALLSTAALLCLIAAIATPITLHYTDPDLPIQQTQAELARGRKVTLIDENGFARWYHCRLGEQFTQMSPSAADGFSVYSGSVGLVELLRDPQRERYRLRAEIKHLKSDEGGRVGVFLAYQRVDVPEGVLHSFVHLRFNNIRSADAARARMLAVLKNAPKGKLPPPRELNPVELDAHLYFVDFAAGTLDRPLIPGVASNLVRPSGPLETPWRTLVLDVSPEGIQGTFDGKLVGTLTKASIVDGIRQAMKQAWPPSLGNVLTAQANQGFQPRGALGLYVEAGAASFRAVTVEPLEGK